MEKVVKKLMRNIWRNKKIHYFPRFPADPRNEIIIRLREKYQENVRIISEVEDWGKITGYKEKVKVIKRADKIIDTYGLGKDFDYLIKEGSFYLLFSNESFNNKLHKEEWLKFKQNPFSFERYIYEGDNGNANETNYKRKMVLRKEKIDKWCRWAVFFVKITVLILCAFAYLTSETIKKEFSEGHGTLLKLIGGFGLLLGLLNLLFPFNIYELLTKKVDSFLYRLLTKYAYKLLLKKYQELDL